MPKTVTIHEAKTQLSRLLTLVQAGETVIIAKNRQPIARLVPVSDLPAERPIGLYAGQVVMRDDWDDPLPGEMAEAFGS